MLLRSYSCRFCWRKSIHSQGQEGLQRVAGGPEKKCSSTNSTYCKRATSEHDCEKLIEKRGSVGSVCGQNEALMLMLRLLYTRMLCQASIDTFSARWQRASAVYTEQTIICNGLFWFINISFVVFWFFKAALWQWPLLKVAKQTELNWNEIEFNTVIVVALPNKSNEKIICMETSIFVSIFSISFK